MAPDKRPDSAKGQAQLLQNETASQAPSAADALNRELPPAAQRALAEAAERRRDAAKPLPPSVEINGRGGPDPARYGDWEVNGIVSDF
jgi:hypothetical protein